MYHIAIKYKHVARLKTDHAYTMLAHHSHARAMLERKQRTGRLARLSTQCLWVVLMMQRLLPAALPRSSPQSIISAIRLSPGLIAFTIATR